jgi:mevalonate kinase
MPETKEQRKTRLKEELAELESQKEDLKEEETETKKEAKEATGDEKKELNRQASAVAADAASVQTLIELSEALLKKLGATDEEIKTVKSKAKARNRY